jgi:hypothetical protein
MAESAAKVTPQSQWRGMNLLGQCLVATRTALRVNATT